MADITKIPIEELAQDYSECLEDLKWCIVALVEGMTEDRDGDCIICRLEGNLKMMDIIYNEVMRRDSNLDKSRESIFKQVDSMEPKYG